MAPAVEPIGTYAQLLQRFNRYVFTKDRCVDFGTSISFVDEVLFQSMQVLIFNADE